MTNSPASREMVKHYLTSLNGCDEPCRERTCLCEKEAAGYVIVPREPTEIMVDLAVKTYLPMLGGAGVRTGFIKAYKAAIGASDG